MEPRDAPKLKRVIRRDSIPAGSTYFNEQGFLYDTPVVTSVGIFEYFLPDGGVRRELRLPEYVFEKGSLASYIGKPVIITHNAGEITKDNVMDEIVGTITSEGFRDGEDVRCKIVIHDIDKVKSIPYRELSLGYSLDLIEEPGVWNGEKYDAIQTNIRINHLAIVESARAGEQAHLNLDGKKVEIGDKKTSEEVEKVEDITRKDSVALTPEELVAAINAYRASNPAAGSAEPKKPEEPEKPEKGEGMKDPMKKPEAPEPKVPEPKAPEATVPEKTVPEIPVQEKEKKDGTNEKLLAVLKQAIAILEGGEEPAPDFDNDGECSSEDENKDSSEDMSGSMNNDSADDVIRQKLEICRIGDKLNLDGLEEKSLVEGKKAIIANVFPDMRMDGKDTVYVDAAYDMAVSEITKRKDTNYQRMQMTGNPPARRNDGNTGESMASQARRRMIEREGGNE